MEEQSRALFKSWDGLEEDEISTLRGLTQSLVDLKIKQSRGKTINRATEKRIQEETYKLTNITRSWARRPLPITTHNAPLSDADRMKLRKVYAIVQEGLQDPNAASNPSFVARLRRSCELADKIGPTESNPPQDGIVKCVKDVIVKDREDILEEARRIVFSPAPDFEDIEEEPDDIPVIETKEPFFVDEDIEAQYPWPDEEIEKARVMELDKGELVDVPGQMYGTVRYVGRIKGDAKEVYVGVELCEEFAGMGTSGGDFKGESYFTTASAKSALFIPLAQVSRRSLKGTPRSPLAPQNPGSPSAEAYSRSTVFFGMPMDKNEFLSLWFPSPFRHPQTGNKYHTAGQNIMYQKAMYFNDEDTASKILSATDSTVVKTLGDQIQGYDQEIWELAQFDIIVSCNYNKFKYEQRSYGSLSLRQRLLDTGDAELVYADQLDSMLGIGYRAQHAEMNRDSWGMNLLGKALMKARKFLSTEIKDEYDDSMYFYEAED